MSSCLAKRLHVGGGLIRSASAPHRMRACLRDGADVSWLPRCRVGDDQGKVGACAIFSMASWAEIVHGYDISDAQCLRVYAETTAALGRGDTGLTFQEAFVAAHKANWLPGARSLDPVYDLDELKNQPILAAYTVTPAWDNPNNAGCLDHQAPATDLGGHATVIAGHGVLSSLQPAAGPLVYVENSWGLSWAWHGICVMTEDMHLSMCNELWVIR